MWTIAACSAPVWSATSAIACAWSESLGTVRKNSPPSGNPSSASALAVGEHANVPDDTISSSVLSAIVDDPGPTMTSTSSVEERLDRGGRRPRGAAFVGDHRTHRHTHHTPGQVDSVDRQLSCRHHGVADHRVARREQDADHEASVAVGPGRDRRRRGGDRRGGDRVASARAAGRTESGHHGNGDQVAATGHDDAA